jgi:hypothetical protein
MDDRLWWRYGRRLLVAVATAIIAVAVLIPFAIGYGVTRTSCAPRCRDLELGAAYENVEFTTSDGLKLKGWYIPSKNGAAVISFPGRSGTQNEARMLARHGYGVLLFDRRGEGESEGDPNAFGWQGERDIHAAVAFLQRRSDVDPARIGGIGLSVGGEMMIEAAAESSALKATRVRGRSGRSVRDILANPDRHGRKCRKQRGHGRDCPFTNNLPPADRGASCRRSHRAGCSSSTASGVSPSSNPPTARSPTRASRRRSGSACAGHVGGLEARPKEYEPHSRFRTARSFRQTKRAIDDSSGGSDVDVR